MAGAVKGQGGKESLADTIRRRAREAETAAYEGLKQAIRAGKDLELKTPRDVLTYGAKLLHEQEARAAKTVRRVVRVTKREAGEALDRLGRNETVRGAAGSAALVAGNVAGIGRGGIHAAQGLADGAVFAGRLLNPFDRVMSPKGQSAEEQLGRTVAGATRATTDYVRKGIADPGSVLNDIRRTGERWNRDLNPAATPVAPTFKGELRRNFDIGQNQGEVLFDVGSLVVGGPAAKAVKGLSRAANVGNDAKYLAQGFRPKVAAYLAEPYPASAMGSHYVPRRVRLPESFGGGPLPKSYMDGAFNRLAPPGISRGDMYELHYNVDPRFNVARLPGKVGGGVWHSGKIGLETYSLPGRLWHGAPAPLKARVGGLGASAGAAMYLPEDEEGGW